MTVPYDVIQDVMLVIKTIEGGKTPSAACDDCNFSYSTFCLYTTRYPQLAELRKEAEDRLYDRMAEALPKIFDDKEYGVADPKEASVISSNIKWLLERRRQKQYGAHSVVEHQITADREVLDALQRAKARAQGGDFNDMVVEKIGEVLDLTIMNGIASVPETDEERYKREFSEIS